MEKELNQIQRSEIECVINNKIFEYDKKISKRLEYTADMGYLQYLTNRVENLENKLEKSNEIIYSLIDLLIYKQTLNNNEVENYIESKKVMEKIKESLNETI